MKSSAWCGARRCTRCPGCNRKAGAQAARAAAYFLQTQVETGSLCPTTMTFAAIPVLQDEPALFASLKDKLFSRQHDARDLPLDQKRSIMIGMGMTEKQGGSDVRTNTTRGAAARQRSGARRRIPADRPQMVFLGADVRRPSDPGAQRGRPVVLLRAALASGRQQERDPDPAPERQARQPLQLQQRSRIRRRLWPHDRRGRPRHPDHHRDGELHPARLRDRQRRHYARRLRAGRASRPPSGRLRQAVGRAAR